MTSGVMVPGVRKAKPRSLKPATRPSPLARSITQPIGSGMTQEVLSPSSGR
jgi:hypothetical protein